MIPAFEGGRWLVVNPYTRDQFQNGDTPPEGLSAEPSLVVSTRSAGTWARRSVSLKAERQHRRSPSQRRLTRLTPHSWTQCITHPKNNFTT
jgi:hypothetical protein